MVIALDSFYLGGFNLVNHQRLDKPVGPAAGDLRVVKHLWLILTHQT